MPQTAMIKELRLALASKQATVDALMKGYHAVDFPKVDGLTFDVLYQPAATIEQLGGDWYDVFMLPDGRVVRSRRRCMNSLEMIARKPFMSLRRPAAPGRAPWPAAASTCGCGWRA